MATAVLRSLQTDLDRHLASLSSSRQSASTRKASSTGVESVPQDELKSQVQAIWNALNVPEALGDGEAEGSQTPTRRGDVVRNILDLIGRELVVSPLINGELVDPPFNASPDERLSFITNLSERLDLVLSLYEVSYETFTDVPSLEPGAIFIPLLEELVELISVETWRDLWTYVETRSKRFTNDMPASKGKALPLLRTINAFLRFLPRTPADLVFRGRVHQFASSVISIADKSAINMRGDYGDIKTTWEEQLDVEEEVAKEETDGDVKMEGDETKETKPEEDQSPKPPSTEPDFYATLWSLQEYFASPPSLAGPARSAGPGEPPHTPFDDFKTKSDFVLPKLFEQTVKEKELMGTEKSGDGSSGSKMPHNAVSEVQGSKKRKRGAVEAQSPSGTGTGNGGKFFHPRYLTGRRLLDYELADSSFRRQILVQYFILFQFLLNLTPASASKQAFTGGMPKDFVIDSDKEAWVKSKISSIREELRRMPGDGTRFEEVVLSIIARERHYAQWKNENCPEKIFEVPPLTTETATEAAQVWKKRLDPPPRYPFPVGSRSLSRLWNKGFTNLDQLKGWKRRATVESLTEEIKVIEADEEDDKAMGREPEPEQAAENADRKTKLNWRALRLASRTSLRHFNALASKRDIQLLSKAETQEADRIAAIRAQAEAARPSNKTTDSTDNVGSVVNQTDDAKAAGDADGNASDDDEGLTMKPSEVENANAGEEGDVEMGDDNAEASEAKPATDSLEESVTDGDATVNDGTQALKPEEKVSEGQEDVLVDGETDIKGEEAPVERETGGEKLGFDAVQEQQESAVEASGEAAGETANENQTLESESPRAKTPEPEDAPTAEEAGARELQAGGDIAMGADAGDSGTAQQ